MTESAESQAQRIVATMKRIAASHGGRLPVGVQAQLCKDCGLSKARMSALAREAGMRRARTGRAPAEDQAATRKLVEQGVIGAKPQEPPPPTERAKGAFQGEGTGSAREGSPGVPPAMRSRGARNRVASSEV